MALVGLLAILDPEYRAKAEAERAERDRVIEQLARQVGWTTHEAKAVLEDFEQDVSMEGQALN